MTTVNLVLAAALSFGACEGSGAGCTGELGPCPVLAGQVVRWVSPADAPGQRFFTCAFQGTTNLGCAYTPRYTIATEGGPLTVKPTCIQPVRYWDASPGSLVTVTLRTINGGRGENRVSLPATIDIFWPDYVEIP